QEGARVGVADIDLEAARRVAREIDPAGAAAEAVAMDVADEGQVEAGVKAVAARVGGIDILVSNAGIQPTAPLVQLSLADWRKVLSIHLDGAFLTTRSCMRRMIQQGRGGRILYTGSVHSVEASPLKAPYIAAKHGLIGLARLVAKEGAAHGIGANVVCPGFV